MTAFRTLLRKDWRINRTPLIGGLIMIGCLYALAVGILLFTDSNRNLVHRVSHMFVDIGFMAMGITALMASVFGGAAFATERQDRSAEFLAMMPVSRELIICSKFLAALGALAILWIINVLVLVIASSNFDSQTKLEVAGLIVLNSTAQFMLLGVGWLLSTFLRSATLAACIPIAFTLLLLATGVIMLNELVNFRGREKEMLAFWLVVAVTTVIGMLSLTGGSLYYLRRVAP